MDVPSIGIRKYTGHWQDFIDRELNSMDHLIQNSFAEFRKEVNQSNRVRRASEDDSGLDRHPVGGIKVPVPSVSTLPRQKAVPQEPRRTLLSGEDSTYVPPGIRELETLYAPMKNLNLPPLSLGDMPKPHPLPFQNDDRDETETLCSGLEDIPPLPPPVQSHAFLQEGSKSLLLWGPKSSRPEPPRRTNSKLSLRPNHYHPHSIRFNSKSSSPSHHRTSLMSTGSSESSGSSSMTSERLPDLFRCSPDYESITPARHDNSILSEYGEEEYVKMQPVFTSRDNFHRTTHYINLLYSAAVSRESPALIGSSGSKAGSSEALSTGSHVYEEPERCKTDSGLRARKKRARAMAEYRELMAEVETKRRYRIGLNLFNREPMLGIQYLSNSFLELSPPSVAKFLHDCSGLSKHKVGEYISELGNAFCMKVLTCFMDRFDFSDLRMDKAVRKVLELLHIPGDASRLRKILEVFSKRYVKCNPGFVSGDDPCEAVLAFSYAVLLLMTEEKKKKKLNEFTERLSRFHLDSKTLKSVYKAVKKEDFVDGGDHYTQTLVLQERILEPNSRQTARIASHSRRLVCICQMLEVPDIMAKKDPDQNSRRRDIFLFNDLLIVTRQSSKFGKKTSLIYKDSFPLVGLELSLFHTSLYGFGVQIVRKGSQSPESVLLTLNADSELDRYKFVMDLQESILEANQTEEAIAKLREP